MAPFRRGPGRPRNDEPPAPSRVVEVKIPLEILEQLEAVAKSEGKTRHYAIREAIAEWVEKHSKNDPTLPESGTSVGQAGNCQT